MMFSNLLIYSVPLGTLLMLFNRRHTLISTLAFLTLPSFAKTKNHHLLIVGDSLCAGYGLERTEDGWVSLMQRHFKEHQWTNVSVSGQTSAAALSTFDQHLKNSDPTICVIALGANDALRGLNLDLLQTNLETMVLKAKESKVLPIIMPMHVPPNYGNAFTRRFNGIYSKVADAHKIPMGPFLLDPIVTDFSYFLPDRIHPNAKGQQKVFEYLLPFFSKTLKAA